MRFDQKVNRLEAGRPFCFWVSKSLVLLQGFTEGRSAGSQAGETKRGTGIGGLERPLHHSSSVSNSSTAPPATLALCYQTRSRIPDRQLSADGRLDEEIIVCSPVIDFRMAPEASEGKYSTYSRAVARHPCA